MEATVEDFHCMDIDQRIIKAIASLNWLKPTPIQQAAVPLILEGRNVLARARTGSGKTAAFVIPIIQKILQKKQFEVEQKTTVLIITPSKELCNQAAKNVKELIQFCSKNVSFVDISAQQDVTVLKPLLAVNPDIIVGTPSKLLAQVRAKHISLVGLETMVIDEADLVFSFGHEEEMKELRSLITKDQFQVILMSATLASDVKSLRKSLLKKAVWCRVELPDEAWLPSSAQLVQYIIRSEEQDKFVILCALFKLKLIRGKTLIFTNSVDRCFRLKLFMEEFGVKSVILNSELPVASRCHTVDQFNQGLYDILLASDESELDNNEEKTDDRYSRYNRGGSSSRTMHRRSDHEYGVSRGIDFQQVSNAINFDFPKSAGAYIHRVGRTARADQRGTALSLVSEKEMPTVGEVEKLVAGDVATDSESMFKPFQFRMSEIDGFRYRAQDAMRKVTKSLVREARMKEIKTELLNASRLKGYFEDNKIDLHVLRHDKQLNSITQPQLKDVPEYLVPSTLRDMMGIGEKRRRRLARGNGGGGASKVPAFRGGSRGRGGKGAAGVKRKQHNPLFTFKASMESKKKK